MNKQITFLLPAKEHLILQKTAAWLGVPLSNLIRYAIHQTYGETLSKHNIEDNIPTPQLELPFHH